MSDRNRVHLKVRSVQASAQVQASERVRVPESARESASVRVSVRVSVLAWAWALAPVPVWVWVPVSPYRRLSLASYGRDDGASVPAPGPLDTDDLETRVRTSMYPRWLPWPRGPGSSLESHFSFC